MRNLFRFSIYAALCLSFTISSYSYAEQLRISLISKGSQTEYWNQVAAGARRAATDLDVRLEIRTPSNDDNYLGQETFLRRAIEANYQAIVIAPNHLDRYNALIKRAVDQGIKVIVIDSAVSSTDPHTFIATDNYQSGVTAGILMTNLLQGKGRVMMLRFLIHNAGTDARERGFVDSLSGTDIEIVIDDYAGASLGEAFRSAVHHLDSGILLDGIFTPNESTTEGLLKALKSQATAQQYKVVGFDYNDDLLKGVDEGYLNTLIAQQPFTMGYLGIEKAVAALNGEQLADYIPIETVLLEQETLDSVESIIK